MTNRVKEERKNKQITQADLAEKVKVSRQSILAIESGRYVPSTILALKIATVLNLKVEDLFDLEDDD